MPLIFPRTNALPSMSYKLSSPLKWQFGILLLQPSQMLTWMTFISLHALFLLMAYNAGKKFPTKLETFDIVVNVMGIFLEDVTRHLYGVVAFDDVANQLMGISAKDLCLLSNEATSIVEVT